MTNTQKLELKRYAVKAFKNLFGIEPKLNEITLLEYSGIDYFLVGIGNYDYKICYGKITEMNYQPIQNDNEFFRKHY